MLLIGMENDEWIMAGVKGWVYSHTDWSDERKEGVLAGVQRGDVIWHMVTEILRSYETARWLDVERQMMSEGDGE